MEPLRLIRKAALQAQTLIRILIIKLEPYATYAEKGKISVVYRLLICLEFVEIHQADIAEKVEAPGGPALLEIIGKIYLEVCIQIRRANMNRKLSSTKESG